MQTILPPSDSADAALCRWQEAGLIKSADMQAARAVANTLAAEHHRHGAWQQRLAWLGLSLGALSFGAGVIFFFAYNWADLHRFAKFAVLEGAMLGLLGLLFMLERREIATGKGAILLMLDLLFGALLAVVGQVYQTGADPWQLFALWSVFSLLLAMGYRSDWLWCCVIGQLNIALTLYFSTRFGLWAMFDDQVRIIVVIASVNLVLHLLLDAAPRFKITAATMPFASLFALLLALGYLVWLAALLVFDSGSLLWGQTLYGTDGASIVGAGLLLLSPLVYLYYRRINPSAIGLGLWGFAAIGVATMALSRLILESSDDPVGIFMLVGMFVLGCSSALVVYLKAMLRDMSPDVDEPVTSVLAASKAPDFESDVEPDVENDVEPDFEPDGEDKGEDNAKERQP